MLLQASFHAIDGATPDLETAVDGRRVEACFQQLFDVLLHLWRLLASAWHFSHGFVKAASRVVDGGWIVKGVEIGARGGEVGGGTSG